MIASRSVAAFTAWGALAPQPSQTAKALGITIAPVVMRRATEVIE